MVQQWTLNAVIYQCSLLNYPFIGYYPLFPLPPPLHSDCPGGAQTLKPPFFNIQSWSQGHISGLSSRALAPYFEVKAGEETLLATCETSKCSFIQGSEGKEGEGKGRAWEERWGGRRGAEGRPLLVTAQQLYADGDALVPLPGQEAHEAGVKWRVEHVLLVRVVVDVALEYLWQQNKMNQWKITLHFKTGLFSLVLVSKVMKKNV